MAFTYDPTTARGKVRLLVPDRVQTGAAFTDEEIDAFLLLNDDNSYRAAADALETASTDLALTLRVTKLLDLQVDGVAPVRALLARAKMLRQRADEADGELQGGQFDIAEQVLNTATWRERLSKEYERDGL